MESLMTYRSENVAQRINSLFSWTYGNTHKCQNDQVKEDKMNRTLSTHEKEVDLNERIILKLVLEEEGRECGLDSSGSL
jgi:hypothetical protein